MSAALPNLYLMESVRSLAGGFFADLVDAPPVMQDGRSKCPSIRGWGCRWVRRSWPLRPGCSERGVTVVAGWTSGDPWAGQVGDRV